MEILHPKLWVVGSNPTCRVSPAVAQLVEQKSTKPPVVYPSPFHPLVREFGEWCRKWILLTEVVGSSPIGRLGRLVFPGTLVAQLAGQFLFRCSFAGYIGESGGWCSRQLLRFGNERLLVRIQPAQLKYDLGGSSIGRALK